MASVSESALLNLIVALWPEDGERRPDPQSLNLQRWAKAQGVKSVAVDSLLRELLFLFPEQLLLVFPVFLFAGHKQISFPVGAQLAATSVD